MSKSPVRWFDPDKFRMIRNQSGHTYASLTRNIPLPPATISHWEKGLFKPSLEALVIVMHVLEHPLAATLTIPPHSANLSDLRILALLEREEVAKELDLTVSGYALIERGQTTLREDRAEILAKLFNVTVPIIYDAWEISSHE